MVNSEDLVSVIIPTRNRSRMLSRAIESVHAQNYEPIELVIVNDASEDDTLEIIENWPKREVNIISIHNKEKCGGAEARNIGISAASGKYIAFLDDDDECLPGRIDGQLGVLKSQKGVGAVACSFYRIANGKKNEISIPSKINLEWMMWENLLGSFSCCMVRREVLGDIRIDTKLLSSQDWYLWIELMKVVKVGVLNRPLVNIYEHKGMRISSGYRSKYAGLRRMYFNNYEIMGERCRVYRFIYLIIYRAYFYQCSFKRKFGYLILMFKADKKFAGFILLKIFLSRISRVFQLGFFNPNEFYPRLLVRKKVFQK